MQPALCSGHHIALVFHRTGAQQQRPMRLACGVGESGGQQQHLEWLLGAEKFGKAHIVAHARRHVYAIGRQARHGGACGDGVGLGIALAQAGIAE